MKHRPVRILTAFAAVPLMLVLSACGDADAEPDAEVPTAAAPGPGGEPSGADGGGPESDGGGPGSDGGGDPGQGAGGTDGHAGSAVMDVGGRTLDVALTMCHVDADAGDVLLAGPASEGGEVVGYLEGGAADYLGEVSSEIRIDLGADGPMQSTDSFLTVGNSLGAGYELAEEAGGYRITSGAWDEHGTDLGQGVVTFTCS